MLPILLGQIVMDGKVVFQASISLSMDITVGDDWYRCQVTLERYKDPVVESIMTDNQRLLKTKIIYFQ